MSFIHLLSVCFFSFIISPWYKRKRFFFGAGVAILLIILIILLATLLATRKKGPKLQITSTSITTTGKKNWLDILSMLFALHLVFQQYTNNTSVYAPVSDAYAFYSFDYNVQDLYGLHNGKINQGIGSYTEGYVGAGYAIVSSQLISTWISVPNSFNLTGAGFTIEAFISYPNDSISANLVEFSSGMSMNIDMNRLEFIFNNNYKVTSFLSLTTHVWHHVAVVYNSVSHYTYLYIDGEEVGQLAYVSGTSSGNDNLTLTIGNGFEGYIDQLSISSEIKSGDRILWDATVAAYYPLDGYSSGWLLDYGPNCLNATSGGTQAVSGKIGSALQFTMPSGNYQASGFTALNEPFHSFTVALWIRSENQSGVFLTIANSEMCLLVIGIRSSDNSIVAYLPNATNTNVGINLISSPVTNNQWVHVAFTWSPANQAQLYKDAVLQDRNSNATQLNNGHAESMSVALGSYRGQVDCTGGDGLNMTTQFFGSVDESYIFSRELQQSDIVNLTLITYSS